MNEISKLGNEGQNCPVYGIYCEVCDHFTARATNALKNTKDAQGLVRRICRSSDKTAATLSGSGCSV